MAVHPHRVHVDRAGQGGECLQVGKGGLPEAQLVLAECHQLRDRGGVGDRVDHRLQDPGGVPVPLPLVGADTGGHPLADPGPEGAPVRAGGGRQLVGDVCWKLGGAGGGHRTVRR